MDSSEQTKALFGVCVCGGGSSVTKLKPNNLLCGIWGMDMPQCLNNFFNNKKISESKWGKLMSTHGGWDFCG